MVKHLPMMQEIWVWSLGQEDPLEKEMATHSSILVWKIPWTEDPGQLQSMGSQRAGHDWVTFFLSFPCKWQNSRIWLGGGGGWGHGVNHTAVEGSWSPSLPQHIWTHPPLPKFKNQHPPPLPRPATAVLPLQNLEKSSSFKIESRLAGALTGRTTRAVWTFLPFYSYHVLFEACCKLWSTRKYQWMWFTHSFNKYLLGI